VTWLPDDAGHPPRVAYAVGRRAGNAVARNRLRRRLRSVIADLAPTLAPGTYLVGAGAGANPLTYDELRTSVSHALAALRRPGPERAP
jgi:ribonuclease P protein component